MHTKLTLRLEERLIRGAKRYSARSGKSISRLVGDYFAVIAAVQGRGDRDLSPRVRTLLGALTGRKVSEGDYRRHLAAKHR
ncbi:MAG: antitoxin [Deltaproteobacteria bacterium]|nr:antitoxin [Deltaproteobacteria bacterium]